MMENYKDEATRFAEDIWQDGYDQGQQDFIKLLESTDSEDLWDIIYQHKKID